MTKTMTKRKIANAVAERIGITQSAAFEAVKAVLDTVSDMLAKGGHIELRGFGVFEIITQRPRIGRNPNNPAVPVQIPQRNVVKFRAGNELSEKVRKLKVK
ncbi:MAG: integration host factor subunit beta [Lentisphaeria bacterium]|nr:integration host factor subunit beta [Lentisphaeria bacterium]